MFEDRRRGRDLARIVSYGYFIIGIIVLILTFVLNSDAGAVALAQRGASIINLFAGTILYFIIGFVLYYLSTKYENDDMLWKLYIIIVIVTLLFLGFGPILLAFALLLVVSAYDIRKELN